MNYKPGDVQRVLHGKLFERLSRDWEEDYRFVCGHVWRTWRQDIGGEREKRKKGSLFVAWSGRTYKGRSDFRNLESQTPGPFLKIGRAVMGLTMHPTKHPIGSKRQPHKHTNNEKYLRLLSQKEWRIKHPQCILLDRKIS